MPRYNILKALLKTLAITTVLAFVGAFLVDGIGIGVALALSPLVYVLMLKLLNARGNTP